ncbi:hypothetical protein QYF61_012683 [Mycteria americana]|uniref:Uncharacterized protein n=1 Tax=Mycteria americana TaxID=33587 RepID=A0AAN7NDT9_MYCAM|nr:hypothetical protein QYF61_012683 [Mycteria americana]
MFFIIIIIFIAITFLIMIFHVCRKLCHDPAPPPPYRDAQGPVPPPPYRDPQGPVPPPLAPMPALPSLPGGAIPVGLEPPRYSEVGPTRQWVPGTRLSLAWGDRVGDGVVGAGERGGGCCRYRVVGAGAMGWWVLLYGVMGAGAMG